VASIAQSGCPRSAIWQSVSHQRAGASLSLVHAGEVPRVKRG
jgi:hypothetical protein